MACKKRQVVKDSLSKQLLEHQQIKHLTKNLPFIIFREIGDFSGLEKKKAPGGKKLPRGVEPRTLCLLSTRSNQLSYES